MLKRLHERLIQPILAAHDSPEAVAGGVAIGLGIALTPTVGIQMPLAWLVATLCGANRVVALALVWVSNPLTVVPMYYLEYLLGSRLLARASVTSYQDFQALWAAMADLGYLARIRTLSDALLLPLVVGSGVPAVLIGAASYPASLWWVRRRRQRHARSTSVQGAATAEGGNGAAPVEPVEPVDPDSLGHDRAGDSTTARVGALLLLGLLPVLGGCLDRGSSKDLAAMPRVVSLTDQQCALWVGSLEQGLVAVVGPLHPGDSQSDYTQARLRDGMGEAGLHLVFLSLQVHHLGEEGPAIEFGSGPASLEVVREEGRFRSLEPSVLLEGVAGAHDRALLSSLMGGNELPALGPGQALRLLVALPEEAAWQEAGQVDLRLGDVPVSLQRRILPAEEWDLLLQHLTHDALLDLLKEPGERP